MAAAFPPALVPPAGHSDEQCFDLLQQSEYGIGIGLNNPALAGTVAQWRLHHAAEVARCLDTR
jgi:hypothetical protein